MGHGGTYLCCLREVSGIEKVMKFTVKKECAKHNKL